MQNSIDRLLVFVACAACLGISPVRSQSDDKERLVSPAIRAGTIPSKPWRGPSPSQGAAWPTNAHFFQRYWFQMGAEFDNPRTNNRFRVNDPYAATHPDFHSRLEPKGNGMMLIPFSESLRSIDAARLSLELWGGHPHTSGRRVTVNGRSMYTISAPASDQCTHLYPQIPLKITDLVNGPNAIQFAVDGDDTFWGHFIVEEAGIDALLLRDDPRVRSLSSLGTLPSEVLLEQVGSEVIGLSFPVEPPLEDRIAAVHYFALYEGFDENGNGQTKDWHGMTKHKIPMGHVGTSYEAPYVISWDTSMLQAQKDVRVRALAEFRNQDAELQLESELQAANERYWKAETLFYQSSPSNPFAIEHPDGVEVAYLKPDKMSKPFWSRANQVRSCEFALNVAADQIEAAQLSVCCWDGGAGDVDEYFNLNDYFIPIADAARHDVLYSVAGIPIEALRAGINRVHLKSSTKHHGIEILYPGPMLTIRYRRF